MEAEEGSTDVVHPEVRAHINSLVSALGGTSADDDGVYKLGDDALECLRDIKRWIRFYDEKTNRMDVARCLAEANLVGGDLLQILATWPENCTDNKFRAKIALACYEIMVPLTWPVERDLEKMTINHHRHLPRLQLAQLGYKRAIINFDGAPILHTAVRVALPSMAIPIGDRTARDQGIIKLMLFFLRNIAMISPPPGYKDEGDESQISRSVTIDAFSYQDIFLVLLTIASNMGEDFRTEDVVVMETIFHLVKRVDVKKLFLDEQELNQAKAAELTAMMDKEAAMLRSHNQKAPKRHNRFGTMIWVKRANGKMSSLSGQDALRDNATRELKMDNSKNFRPPKRARKDGMEPKDLGLPPALNHRANKQLRSFVEDFLDSGFNPLFQHIRKSIDREAPHVLDYHKGQFFYLVAWFLEAERVRRQMQKATKKASQNGADDVGSFNLVAGVLNQEMFISLNRALDRSYTEKDWPQLTTVMRCFTQILLTVQEMTDSGNEEDEEIAENTLNRLFYEETTHDAVANIVRTYKDQGFEYLDACTDLTHTYLRILEAYSKQNVDLQVRSRKRTRRKKKAAKAVDPNAMDEDQGDGDDDDSANDERDAERTSSERKFDFKRFALRFIPQGVVDTFVKFTKYYKDLDESQLKRAHRYFYRVAFKQEMSVMLFRVDIIHLLYNMVKGPEPLDKNSSTFKEWEELVKQIIKRCVRKLEERPALITELLFSKINSTAHYLEYGYEKQTVSSNPRPAAELEFRHIVDHDQQIGIAVGALLDKSQGDNIAWVKKQLSDAESERKAWEAAELAMPSVEGLDAEAEGRSREDAAAKAAPHITVRPDSDTRRTAMFKNPHLRLLMKLVGMERLAPTLDETMESTWIVPPGITAGMLNESLDLINKAEFSPLTFDNDESAADQLRRKAAPRKRAVFDDGDDDDGLIDDNDDGILFPMGGPTVRKAIDGDAPRKKLVRRRRQRDGSEGPTDEQLEERARKRKEKELEKARRVKSEMYVHASDDETDDERDKTFFERENAKYERLQKDMSSRLNDLLAGSDDEDIAGTQRSAGGPEAPSGSKKSKKRKSNALLMDDDSDASIGGTPAEEGEGEDDMPSSNGRRKRRKSDSPAESDDGDDDAGTDDAPQSSGSRNERPAVVADEDDEDEPVAVPVRSKRPRVRGGFVVDSSDEE